MSHNPYCDHAGCLNYRVARSNYCASHITHERIGKQEAVSKVEEVKHTPSALAVMYPKYYKALPSGWTVVDTYAVNILFPVDDPSGCLLHARKKLLVPGVRSGGKSMRKDIQEARDTLNRWLELNPE